MYRIEYRPSCDVTGMKTHGFGYGQHGAKQDCTHDCNCDDRAAPGRLMCRFLFRLLQRLFPPFDFAVADNRNGCAVITCVQLVSNVSQNSAPPPATLHDTLLARTQPAGKTKSRNPNACQRSYCMTLKGGVPWCTGGV